MSKTQIVDIQPVKADAELMSAWLGDMEDISISPKLLFDLQTLLRHYADFLVPDKKVSIDYACEGIPCASVDKNQVFIPVDMLKEGRVDETISAVIHELHHIKLSDGETEICRNLFPYFKRILKTVEVEHYGRKMSLWDALASHGNMTANQIVQRELKHKYKEFIYQFFGDLFLLMNAVEDVRIDEMQPENLKKYRFKHEKICYDKFAERIAEGEIDTNTLHGQFLNSLFHWKGYVKDDIIANSNLTSDFIKDVETPNDYFPNTFQTFGKVVQDHAGALWKQFEEQTEMNQSAISDFLADEVGEQGGDTGSLQGDEELKLEPKKASDCTDMDAEFVEQVRHELGEDDIRDLLTAMGNPAGDTGADNKGEPHFVINPQLWAEIQAFKAINHVPCREIMNQAPQGINYDTLIFDCYA